MSTTEPNVTTPPSDDSQAKPTTPVSASSTSSTTPSQPAPQTVVETVPQNCPIDGKRLDDHGFCKRCGYQVPDA